MRKLPENWPAIRDVLAHYGFELPPSRAGWVRCKCRFHDDKTPSAAFNVTVNGFSCLACSIKGSALTLIMDREGVGFAEAVSLAREWFGDSNSPVRDGAGTGSLFPGGEGDRPHGGKTVPSRLRGGTLFAGP